jgi:hypothetical protein
MKYITLPGLLLALAGVLGAAKHFAPVAESQRPKKTVAANADPTPAAQEKQAADPKQAYDEMLPADVESDYEAFDNDLNPSDDANWGVGEERDTETCVPLSEQLAEGVGEDGVWWLRDAKFARPMKPTWIHRTADNCPACLKEAGFFTDPEVISQSRSWNCILIHQPNFDGGVPRDEFIAPASLSKARSVLTGTTTDAYHLALRLYESWHKVMEKSIVTRRRLLPR